MPSARPAARPSARPIRRHAAPVRAAPALASLVAVIAFLGTVGVAIVTAGPTGAAVTPPAQGWNSTEAALPTNAGTATTLGNVTIASSSCPAVNGCVSVGGYHDTGTLPWGLIETQNGTSWTETQAPEPSNAGTGANQAFWFGSQNCGTSQPCRAVSCPSAAFCVAVGEYTDSAGFDQPVVDTLANGAWTSAEGALPSDAATDSTTVHPDAWLYSVSCSSSTSCVAVGTYRNTSDDVNGFVASLSGTTWSAQAAPLPSNARRDRVVAGRSVVCVADLLRRGRVVSRQHGGEPVERVAGRRRQRDLDRHHGSPARRRGRRRRRTPGLDREQRGVPVRHLVCRHGPLRGHQREQLAAHRHVERDQLDRPPGPGARRRQHHAELRGAGLGLLRLTVVVRGRRFLPEHLAH